MDSDWINQFAFFRGPNFAMDRWKLRPARDIDKDARSRWASIERESGLAETIGILLWRSLVGFYLGVFHRYSCVGRENIPKSLPYILIANHSSHLDALCLLASAPRRDLHSLFPIAAADTFFTSLRKAWFSAFAINALPLSRTGGGKGREAMLDLRRRLSEDPCGFILFPEGTRSRTGEMARFRSGLGMLVAGTSVPVVPCAIKGAFEAFPPSARFPRPKKVQLLIGAAMSFEDVSEDEEGWKRVAEKTEKAVSELLN